MVMVVTEVKRRTELATLGYVVIDKNNALKVGAYRCDAIVTRE